MSVCSGVMHVCDHGDGVMYVCDCGDGVVCDGVMVYAGECAVAGVEGWVYGRSYSPPAQRIISLSLR